LVGLVSLWVLYPNGGCAVTTIDVDVYKGPLSNEKAVQIEEFRVMAVGAAKLLDGYQLELSDSLQQLTAKKDRDFRDRLQQVLHNVRSVRSLYDDQKRDPVLESLVIRARESYEEYRQAYSILRPGDPSKHEAAARPLIASFAQPGGPDAEGLRRLQLAYQELLVPRQVNDQWVYFDDRIFEAYQKLDPAFEPDFKKDHRQGGTLFARLGSNEQLELLEDPGFVKEDAALLFADPAVREQFVKRVNEIASSYRRCRQSLERLLRVVLEAIIWLENSPGGVKSAEENRQLLANYATKLLQPRLLAGVLLASDRSDPSAEEAAVHLRARLQSRLPSLFGRKDMSFWNRGTNMWQKDAGLYATLGDALRAELMERPAETARALLDIHDHVKSGQFNATDLENRAGLTQREFGEGGRKYGIARGPTVQAGHVPDPGEVAKLLTAVEHLDAFDRGREREGMFTFIERALAERSQNGSADVEFERLQTALAHFAEKLLSLSHGDALVSVSPPSHGIWTSNAERRMRDQIEVYGRLLQSIGNSILVQVNELSAADRHASGDHPAWEREVRAMGSALPRDTRAVMQRLLDDLLEEQAAGTAANEKRASEVKRLSEVEGPAQTATAQRHRDDATDQDTIMKTARAEAETSRVKAAGGREAAKLARREEAQADLRKVEADRELAKLALEATQLSREHAAAVEKRDATEQKLKDLPDDTPASDKTRLTEELAELKKALEGIEGRLARNGEGVDVQNKSAAAAIADSRLWDARADDVEASAVTAAAEAAEADKRAAAAGQAAAESRARAGTADAGAAAAKAEVERLRGASAGFDVRSRHLDVTAKLVRYFISRWSQTDLDAATPAADVMARMQREIRQAEVGFDATPPADRLADSMADLRVAADVLGSRPISRLAAADVAQTVGKPTAVLDQAIASMEAELRDHVARNGDDSATARHIREAISAAEAYRARMVYIRPPSAYLKNSYPITSLQEGTATAWQNMLSRHSVRSVPIAGELMAKGNPRDAKLREKIDRRFWQNINRVRVASNGRTNYVMAKDDIGNWYVKSFSGDPEPIIKAAKAAALYAGSADLGVDLIAQDRRRQKALDDGLEPPDAPEPAKAFERQVGAFRSRYEKATRAQADALSTGVNAMRADITTAWNDDQLSPTLASADSHLAAAKKALADATGANSRIDEVEAGVADALEALLKYQKAVLDNLASLPKPDTAALEARKAELETQIEAEATAAGAVTGAEASLTAKRAAFDAAHAELVAANTALASTSTTQPTAEAKRVTDATNNVTAAQTALTDAEAAVKTARETADAEKGKTAIARQAVTTEQSNVDKQQAARVTARKVVTTRVGSTVSDFVAWRIKSVDDYQTAVQVVLESSTRAKEADAAEDDE
jgi:hypothetical protein